MFYYKNLKIDDPSSVYSPREDSELMAEALEKFIKPRATKLRAIEIGCGSGFLSILASKLGAKITSVDINPSAISTTLKNAQMNNVQLTAFQSDLFENVSNKFDLIFFNPPYLPDNDNIDGKETWAEGNTIARFITQAKAHLIPNGSILLLISSLTKTPALNLLKKQGFTVEIIAKKKIPWEELSIILAKPI
jgi:release factor glutamine methyltransferase